MIDGKVLRVDSCDLFQFSTSLFSDITAQHNNLFSWTRRIAVQTRGNVECVKALIHYDS